MSTDTEQSRRGTVGRFLPITTWLPGYRRSWVRPDVLAGLTVWALVVPEAMAYASVAGVPVQYGLYAVPLAMLGYLVFGTSRQLVVGPSSSVAALSATTVAAVAANASGDDFIALTAVLALLVGALYVLFGLIRLGFIANFFAKPVLTGFIVGLGIYIAVGQVPKLVGVEKSDGNTLRQLLDVIGDAVNWNLPTVIVGTVSLVALVVIERYLPRLPAALIVVAGSIFAAELLGLDQQGVTVVGTVPIGFDFVPWSGIGLQQVIDLVPGALAIVVVGFAESLAIAKTYAAANNYRIDANQEMVAYGAASIGAGLLQGYSVSGSLSKTAAGQSAGAKTPIVTAVVAVAVLLTVIFFAGVFAMLPEATLAAVIIMAVWSMIDFSKLRRLWNARTLDFYLALGALLGVVLWEILAGVVIGVVLSIALLLYRLDRPNAAVLGANADRSVFRDEAENDEYEVLPGLLIYRFDAPLIFINADFFIDDLTERVRGDEQIRRVIVDCESISEMDTTGLAALLQARQLLNARDIVVDIAHTKSGVLAFIDRMSATDHIGRDHIFNTVRDAVRADSS